MTNREAHEEAAGMNLCREFFIFNNIDPDAEYIKEDIEYPDQKTFKKNVSKYLGISYEL